MRIELLPVNRWGEIASGEQIPKPENAIMLGALEGDQIVGCVGAERVWCVSPFWVEKEHRGSGLAQQLGNELIKFNTEGFSEMLITTSPHVDRLVFSLGFKPLLGQLWRRERG